jgi:hypothetical protein
MHQQLGGYKVEWRSVSRGMGGKKVEYHCSSNYKTEERGNGVTEHIFSGTQGY